MQNIVAGRPEGRQAPDGLENVLPSQGVDALQAWWRNF